MNLVEEQQGNAVILSLDGRLDSVSAKAFEDKLMPLVDAKPELLIVDFAKLEYISSAGLRVLLMAAKRMKASQGNLALCAMREHVREVFEISGFSNIFKIHPGREAALAG